MLFYVGWRARPGTGPAEQEKSLEVFSRWQPPAGLQIQGMWGRADGGGFCVAEADSTQVIMEACAPWGGSLLDYEVVPILDMKESAAISAKGIAFRKGG